MGRTETVGSPITSYEWRLNAPNMGEYERTGLLGLYLSLQAADKWEKADWDSPVKEKAKALKEKITWSVKDDMSLLIHWEAEENDSEVFTAILEWAWQVHDGVLFLPAIHHKQIYLDNYHLRLPVHNGIFATFLQHGLVVSTENKETVVHYDDDKYFKYRYKKIILDPKRKNPEKEKKIKKFPHWKLTSDILKRGKFDPSHTVKNIPAWIYPGSTTRFGLAEKLWHGKADIAFLLAFTPFACHFVQLPKNWTFVISQIHSFEQGRKAIMRRSVTNANWPLRNGELSGLQDAVLRYLVSERNHNTTEVIAVTMGVVSYYNKTQKVRQNQLRFSPKKGLEITKRYRYFNRIFPLRIFSLNPEKNKKQPDKNAFIKRPRCRERITANLLEGKEWYRDLAYIPSEQVNDYKTSSESQWFSDLREHEGRQLMTLAKTNEMWENPQEEELINVFYRAFRQLLNEEEYAAARGGSGSSHERWDRKVAEIRRNLIAAKTKSLCRETVIGLLAESCSRRRKLDQQGKAAQVSTLLFLPGSGAKRYLWENLEKNHNKVRDIVLLALVTFTDGRLGKSKNSENTEGQIQ